jgi:hypothetical protein
MSARRGGSLNRAGEKAFMFRGMALLIGLVAVIDVYVLDGRHVNAALEIWNRIVHFYGI